MSGPSAAAAPPMFAQRPDDFAVPPNRLKLFGFRDILLLFRCLCEDMAGSKEPDTGLTSVSEFHPKKAQSNSDAFFLQQR